MAVVVQSFGSELCCDFLRIFDGNNRALSGLSGTFIPDPILTDTRYLRLHWTTDRYIIP
jgi:hypothetical protein